MQDATISALHAALRGLSARQRTISDNIANLETPQFLAGRVDFEASLARAIEDGSDSLGRFAAAALGEIGPTAPAAIPALIGSLAHDDSRNRAVAMAALVKMGSRAVPRLIEALSHTNGRVRALAARTLGKGGPWPEAQSALAKLLADGDEGVREAAREALGLR